MVSMPGLSGILIYMSICMDAWVHGYSYGYGYGRDERGLSYLA